MRRSYSKKVAINIDSSLDEQIESDKIKPKRHSGVMNLNCIKLPDTIIKSIQIALEGKNRKQLIEDGLALERKLLHRSIPVETYIWNQAEKQIINNYKQKHPDYDLSNSKTEKQLKNIVDSRLKHLFYNWKPIKYDKNLCLQYLIIRAPAEYAVLKRVFNEIALRDKDFEPKSIFDFGSGVGTVVWAAHDFWSNSIKDYYCVDASSDMHNLATSILQNNNIYNDPFIKTVHYRQFLPSSYRPHDIVVSSFSFFELQNWKERLKVLTTLWNNTTHYLVLIEIGSNAGYNLILEARDYILNASNQQNIECYVFAPCSHELECPRLSAEGKRTPCNFKMAYHQFPLSQLSYKTGIQLFSFLILKKGKKPPLESRQCRIVRDVKLGHKHAVCHLCTNKGKLQSVFVTASKHKKSVYKCFRSSNWGDLTPQGITFEETVDSGELVSDEDSDEENFTDIKTENSEAK